MWLCVLGIQLVTDTLLMENKLDPSCDVERAAGFTLKRSLFTFKNAGYGSVHLSTVAIAFVS